MQAQHQRTSKYANGGFVVFKSRPSAPSAERDLGSRQSRRRQSLAALPLSDAGCRAHRGPMRARGCFGVKGGLQKQIPLPARAAERAPKTRGAAA